VGGFLLVFLFFGGYTFLTPPVSLSPAAHGRGIMTAVLGTVMEKWVIPYMNGHHMYAGYLDHNIASRRVFEKNGWVFDKSEPDRIELPESMTGVKGKKFGAGWMKWDRV
jgi:RimJ/RimL family protein N-acetyltransferase